MPSRPRPTGGTPRVSFATFGPGSPMAGGSCWSPRAMARPSGWPNCYATAVSVPGSRIFPTPRNRPSPAFPTSRPGLSGTASCGRASAKDMRRLPTRRRGGIDPLRLRPGDYVVHEQHGVGRYVEMTSRTVQGATREYLVIEYAPSKRGQPPDRLYVPTDQLDEVTRYVGGEAPTLHRLGGADWARV